MKTVLYGILFTLSFQVSADFIHPMDFDESEQQKAKVIEIIKARVNAEYCEGYLDMCQPTLLRMMEHEELNSFKRATKANNRVIMDQVIDEYCNSFLDMCSYSMILMMYLEYLSASKKTLEW